MPAGYGVIGTDDKVSPDINLTKPPVSLKIDDLVAVTTWLYVHDGQRPPSPAKIVSAFRRFMTPQDWKAVTTIRPPKPPPGYFSLLATGEEPVEEIFRKAQCIVCHVIPGIPDATGSVGPALNMKSAALIRLNPHYSRALLLQSRIRRCDRPGRGGRCVQAGGLAARSVNILFKDASLPRGLGSGACLAHSYKGASPLVESPRRGHTPFGTPRRSVTPPPGSARPSRPPSLTLPHSMGEGWVGDDEPS